MCLAKPDGYRNTFSQTSHSCPLFLSAPFLTVISSSSSSSSFCIWWWFASKSSSSSGILKHNTKGSSFSPFKTVLAFTARFGCGFFLRPVVLSVRCETLKKSRARLNTNASHVWCDQRGGGKKKVKKLKKMAVTQKTKRWKISKIHLSCNCKRRYQKLQKKNKTVVSLLKRNLCAEVSRY